MWIARRPGRSFEKPHLLAMTAAGQLLIGVATRRQVMVAVGVVLGAVFLFALVTPFAKTPLPQITAFIPMFEAALVFCDIIAAVMILQQYAAVRSSSILLLGSGYAYTAAIAACHLLTFPNVFTSGEILGGDQQSAAWLYLFWHGTFPLLLIFYCAEEKRERARSNLRVANGPRGVEPGRAIALGIVCAVSVALAQLTFTVGARAYLPPLIANVHFLSTMTTAVELSGLACLIAAGLLLRAAPLTVVHLWLAVSMLAWLLDLLMTNTVADGRYELGWYVGKLFGLFSASTLLILYIIESGANYGRLALLNTSLRSEIAEREQAVEALQRANTNVERANRELEAFSYSVAHDLRAPLRRIDGFSQALIEDYDDKLDEGGRTYLRFVREGVLHMAGVINDLLGLARIGRTELNLAAIDLTTISQAAIQQLRQAQPDRAVELIAPPTMPAFGDLRLLAVALENLIGNAWKFTSKTESARIELGQVSQDGRTVNFVRGNGAGFDMAYSEKLFAVFQRLHSVGEFEGLGIGLATVQRVILRHGGQIWAEGEVGLGATFYFTLMEGP